MNGAGDEAYLAAVEAMLTGAGMVEAAELLREAETEVVETGYDNWNGGTRLYTVFLAVDPARYGRLGSKRSTLEEQITARVKSVYERDDNSLFSASIRPRIQARPNWRTAPATVSRRTRLNIIDGLKVDNIAWMGTLGDVEFLQRLWDLKALHRQIPASRKPRAIYGSIAVTTMTGMIAGSSMTSGSISLTGLPTSFWRSSPRWSIRSSSRTVIRRWRWYAPSTTSFAPRAGYLSKWKRLPGDPASWRKRSASWAAVRLCVLGLWPMHSTPLGCRRKLSGLKTPLIGIQRWPSGTAKELVESCCKTVLTKRGVTYAQSADLPTLTKLVAKELGLVPEGITDAAKGAETIKLILRNLAALTQYLAELRTLYGSGHGRDGRHKGLQPRHARLAVGAAASFIDFVTETYRDRQFKKKAGTAGSDMSPLKSAG